MNIVEFFDPNNQQHLQAYRHLSTKGFWPLEFMEMLPKDLEGTVEWHFGVVDKMAKCWVDSILGSDSGVTQVRRFNPKSIVVTPGAEKACILNKREQMGYIERHLCGDWGEVDAEDVAHNDHQLLTGGMLMSSFRLPDDTHVWVVTDPAPPDAREVTTLLIPSEY